jgi:hypothetical protein
MSIGKPPSIDRRRFLQGAGLSLALPHPKRFQRIKVLILPEG